MLLGWNPKDTGQINFVDCYLGKTQEVVMSKVDFSLYESLETF